MTVDCGGKEERLIYSRRLIRVEKTKLYFVVEEWGLRKSCAGKVGPTGEESGPTVVGRGRARGAWSGWVVTWRGSPHRTHKKVGSLLEGTVNLKRKKDYYCYYFVLKKTLDYFGV